MLRNKKKQPSAEEELGKAFMRLSELMGGTTVVATASGPYTAHLVFSRSPTGFNYDAAHVAKLINAEADVIETRNDLRYELNVTLR